MKFIKISYIKIVLYFFGALVSTYITLLRVFITLFQWGTQAPHTQTNFWLVDLPDIISIFMCFGYVIIFINKIRKELGE